MYYRVASARIDTLNHKNPCESIGSEMITGGCRLTIITHVNYYENGGLTRFYKSVI